MKLLLDEHFSNEIARRLRANGHDVEAVVERPDLRSLPDGELFARAVAEQRTIVTNNIADFVSIFKETIADGHDQLGLVLTSERSMPRGKPTTGLFVRALDELLRTHTAFDALRKQVHWLGPR